MTPELATGESGRARGARSYRSHVARLFVAHALRLDARAEQAIRRLGVRLTKEAVVELPYDALCDLANTLAHKTGRSCFGFDVARELQRGTYGVVEYVLANAATVEAILTELMRFHPLLSELARVATTRIGDTVTFEHWVEHPAAARGRHSNEFALAAYVTIGERIIGSRPVFHAVRFAHCDPGPADRAVLEAFFAASIEFGARRNQLVFDAGFLATPIASADRTLHDFLAERAERDLALVEPPGELAGQIQSTYRKLLTSTPHRAQAHDVARAVGLSVRSMNRRLAEAATSFRAIEAEVKRVIALRHLADARRSLGDIAAAVGFTETSAFIRAFRRWTGKTPAQIRDELRATVYRRDM